MEDDATSDGESPSSASIRGLSSSNASTVRTRSSGSHKSIALSITSGDKQKFVDGEKKMGGENGEEEGEVGAASEAGSRAASSSIKSRAATAASAAESKASSRRESAAAAAAAASEDMDGGSGRGSKAESEGPATRDRSSRRRGSDFAREISIETATMA